MEVVYVRNTHSYYMYIELTFFKGCAVSTYSKKAHMSFLHAVVTEVSLVAQANLFKLLNLFRLKFVKKRVLCHLKCLLPYVQYVHIHTHMKIFSFNANVKTSAAVDELIVFLTDVHVLHCAV